MTKRQSAIVLTLAFFVGFVDLQHLQGQDQTDFTALETTVKKNDKLTVTTDSGSTVTGKLIEISTERIVLEVNKNPLAIAAPNIHLVERRKNGVLLGAAIGGFAALPAAMT